MTTPTSGRGSTTSGRRSAPAPTGSGRIGVVGPVLALLLTALGALLLREGIVGLGWVAGRPWLDSAAGSLDGFAPPAWVVAAGVVVVLVGLWLLVTALGRRTRRTIAVTSRSGIHLGLRDVARLASGAARDVDGVVSVSTSATRRVVHVRVRALATERVQDEVTTAVRDQLAPLDPTPTVKVTVDVDGGDTGTLDRSEK